MIEEDVFSMMMESLPRPDVSDNRLLDGRVRLRQPKTGYRVAIDPIFLAAAVAASAGETVLDAGCGVGAAALCLATRVADVTVTGIDCDPFLITLAQENICLNGLEGRVGCVAMDLRDTMTTATVEAAVSRTFDHVITNPPYHTRGKGTAPRDPGRRAATVEGDIDLSLWLNICLARLAPHGWLTLIHRSDRLDHILSILAPRLGAIEVFPLWPGGKGGGPARRVLVRGQLGATSSMWRLPGLVLHRPDGSYTDAAESILRHGMALPWRGGS